MDTCDMCGTKIDNGKCACGIWTSAEENKDNPFKLAVEKFHDLKQMVLSMDAPHLGCAAIFFRGDYNDCEVVKNFIKEIKSRPHYKQKEE